MLWRDGFDVRVHALSLLSNGDFGWIQVANFWVAGTLVILGAVGTRRALAGQRGGTWAPLLLLAYGVGLIGAGVFPADPGRGFPPGTPTDGTAISRDGLWHFIFGGIGFYALIAACFVFARRFAAEGARRWSIYSATTGVFFLASFGVMASGQPSVTVMLTFYAAVAWTWGWHSLVMWRLADAPAAPGSLLR